VSVLVLGLSHKTAPVGVLERVAVPAERLDKALASLVRRDHVTEAVVLSTCNRVELYASVTRYHGGMADLRNFFAEWGGLAPEDLADLVYDYFDESAAAHLFAVTSGLDSMVVGERQVHLQVREALKAAEAEGTCGRILQALFRQALRVGKRARAETGIAAGGASMVDVGVGLATRVLGGLNQRTVFLIGAGKMGGMGATRVTGAAGRVLIANRTPEKAERLARRVGAEVVEFGRLLDGLRDADLVIASTGSSTPLVRAEMVASAMRGRVDRPLVFLDLAMPRDVDCAAGDVEGVTVIDLSDIHRLTRHGSTGVAVAHTRAIVEEETRRFVAWTRAVRIEPTIAALRERAEAVRLAELERCGAKLGVLDERQVQALESLTKGIVNTLLHAPTVRLKALADARGADLYAAALRELFDLAE
jgi:glutamyl-tRNA reductase